MKPTEVQAQIAEIKNRCLHILSKPVLFAFNTIPLGTVVIADFVKAKVSDLKFQPDKVFGTSGKNTQVMSIVFETGEIIDIPVTDISTLEVSISGVKMIVGSTTLEFTL